MKRKLTLGLMVFCVGILITACGSKNNTSNTTNNNDKDIPTSFEDGCSSSSLCSYDGKFIIDNEDLYLQAFGHRANSSTIFGDSFVQNILGQLADSVLTPAIGAFRCGSEVYITSAIARLFGTNVETECTSTSSTFTEIFGGSDTLASSYNAILEVSYNDGESDQIRLTVNSDVDSGDDVLIFKYYSANVFRNTSTNTAIINRNGSIELVTTDTGLRIGRFQ